MVMTSLCFPKDLYLFIFFFSFLNWSKPTSYRGIRLSQWMLLEPHDDCRVATCSRWCVFLLGPPLVNNSSQGAEPCFMESPATISPYELSPFYMWSDSVRGADAEKQNITKSLQNMTKESLNLSLTFKYLKKKTECLLASWQTYMCFNLRVPHHCPHTSLPLRRAGLMKLDSWHPDLDSHESGDHRHTSWPSFLQLSAVGKWATQREPVGPTAAILLYCLYRWGGETDDMFACECVETGKRGTNSR